MKTPDERAPADEQESITSHEVDDHGLFFSVMEQVAKRRLRRGLLALWPLLALFLAGIALSVFARHVTPNPSGLRLIIVVLTTIATGLLMRKGVR